MQTRRKKYRNTAADRKDKDVCLHKYAIQLSIFDLQDSKYVEEG
jgi:hypothetical protein